MKSCFRMWMLLVLPGLAACSDSPAPVTPTTLPSSSSPPTTTLPPSQVAVARLSLSVLHVLRPGSQIDGPLPFYRPRDVIQFDLTPRDASNNPIPPGRHPMNAEWTYSSNSLQPFVDYKFDEREPFTPELQILDISRQGFVDIFAKLGGVQSNILHIEVR